MLRAIYLAKQSIQDHGGPFGAVIVKDNHIIAEGGNCVTKNNDPTAHAEIVAIRQAARKLQNFELKGCVLYTSSEPCPRCLAAIYWAHIEHVYYANSHVQASEAGFDDSFIYQELNQPHQEKQLAIEQCLTPEILTSAKEIFQLWLQNKDKTIY